MAKLSLDRDKIDQAKELAQQIVSSVHHFIDRHTTESIERSVLRLLGVSGPSEAKPKGNAPQGRLPLVNEVVKQIGSERLKRGVAYWLGLAALHNPNQDVNQLAFNIASGKIDLDGLAVKPMGDIDRVCQKFLQPQLAILRKIRERKSKRPLWGTSNQPLRYVIVATGNIHEDILQAQAAAEMGADIIAVIRSTAQSLLDYVPEGETTEGYGGTFATQENFRLMRAALDESEKQLKRRIALCNYSSGLCMSEIAVLGALEGVDYLLNDAMYGILFRDINMQRNFVDQFFSRRICALSGITIQTGEDNYLTTADSFKYWFQVLTSHFINHAFAKQAGISEAFLSLGHAFEIDPNIEDSMLYEWAQAQLVRELFPRAPIKFMPPTKHKTGDIFLSYLYDGMFNLAGAITGQTIQLLGMHTEAIHNPYVQDRYLSLKNANYIFNAAKNAKDEISFQYNGNVARRARQVLDDALRLLKKVRMRGMFRAIEEGAFANVRRRQQDGKGLDGVLHKDRDYYTPLKDYLTPRALRDSAESGRGDARNSRGRSASSSSRSSARGGERRGRSRNERSYRDRNQPERSTAGRSRQNRDRNESGKAPKRTERASPDTNRSLKPDAKPVKRRELKAQQEIKESRPRAENEKPASRRNNGPERVKNATKSKSSPVGAASHHASEVDLQKQFHREMLQGEGPSAKATAPGPEDTQPMPAVEKALPRRSLKKEKTVATPKLESRKAVAQEADPEETQKVFESNKPLPRRSLKSGAKPGAEPASPVAKPPTTAPTTAPTTVTKAVTKAVTKEKADGEKAQPISGPDKYKPLPRRSLNNPDTTGPELKDEAKGKAEPAKREPASKKTAENKTQAYQPLPRRNLKSEKTNEAKVDKEKPQQKAKLESDLKEES